MRRRRCVRWWRGLSHHLLLLLVMPLLHLLRLHLVLALHLLHLGLVGLLLHGPLMFCLLLLRQFLVLLLLLLVKLLLLLVILLVGPGIAAVGRRGLRMRLHVLRVCWGSGCYTLRPFAGYITGPSSRAVDRRTVGSAGLLRRHHPAAFEG